MFINLCLGCFIAIFIVIWIAMEVAPRVYERENWFVFMTKALGKEFTESKKSFVTRILIEASVIVFMLIFSILGLVKVIPWLVPIIINSVLLALIAATWLFILIKRQQAKKLQVENTIIEEDEE